MTESWYFLYSLQYVSVHSSLIHDIHVLWMSGDEVLCQVTKSEHCRVKKGISTFIQVHAGMTFQRFAADPGPHCEVWFVCVK
jgi:hypothetical protein